MASKPSVVRGEDEVMRRAEAEGASVLKIERTGDVVTEIMPFAARIGAWKGVRAYFVEAYSAAPGNDTPNPYDAKVKSQRADYDSEVKRRNNLGRRGLLLKAWGILRDWEMANLPEGASLSEDGTLDLSQPPYAALRDDAEWLGGTEEANQEQLKREAEFAPKAPREGWPRTDDSDAVREARRVLRFERIMNQNFVGLTEKEASEEYVLSVRDMFAVREQQRLKGWDEDKTKSVYDAMLKKRTKAQMERIAASHPELTKPGLSSKRGKK